VGARLGQEFLSLSQIGFKLMMNASNLVTSDRELVVPPTGASVQNLPSITWPVMSVDRYAAFEQALGTRLLRTGDIWWVQIRPFFYRPLLPFERYDVEAVKKLVGHRGVFQHAVMEGQAHNSYLNTIIFDDLHKYDPRQLRKNVRGSLKKGMASGATVRPIVDAAEFCEKAYPVYLSFYERTRYAFDKSRRSKEVFIRWARRLFQFSDAVILGAFAGQELISFEIHCLVERTLILKSIVNSESAVRTGAPDLVLHHVRSSASGQSTIDKIYDTMRARNQGINEYKVFRGAKVLALPSLLHIHPALLWSLRKVSRGIYSRLCGVHGDASPHP